MKYEPTYVKAEETEVGVEPTKMVVLRKLVMI
jgi:hypothetical protein